jgi:putative molybdopterin biosynthesis protein
MAHKEFGETIRRKRLSAGLTQATLAKHAAISRQAVAAIEAGAYLPNVSIALKLARAFGESVEELFAEKQDRAQCVEARWKESPSNSTDRTRVLLARVGGKIVALPQPTAQLTLPVSSGVRMKNVRGRAQISTSLFANEIDSTLIVAGCDPAVSLLIAWMARSGSQVNTVALACSSGRALAALADKSVHVAGVHLRDPKSGDYNFASVRQTVGSRPIRLINFACWEVGLATAEGNPRRIEDFCDLARSDVRIVNRDCGAGARQALDEGLAKADLDPERIVGYRHEVGGHLDVAAAVHAGQADTGVTIRVAAEAYGLGFVPIREERYDLAVPESEMESVPVRRMLEVLNSRRFAREVAELCAYDTAKMGSELARIGGLAREPRKGGSG